MTSQASLTWNLNRERGDIEVDDNGFPVRPALIGNLRARDYDVVYLGYNADGRRFDRLFLRFMTFHHLGALTMVHELREAGGGAETEIGVFTNHVEADQGIEIARMRELSAGLR